MIQTSPKEKAETYYNSPKFPLVDVVKIVNVPVVILPSVVQLQHTNQKQLSLFFYHASTSEIHCGKSQLLYQGKPAQATSSETQPYQSMRCFSTSSTAMQ